MLHVLKGFAPPSGPKWHIEIVSFSVHVDKSISDYGEKR